MHFYFASKEWKIPYVPYLLRRNLDATSPRPVATGRFPGFTLDIDAKQFLDFLAKPAKTALNPQTASPSTAIGNSCCSYKAATTKKGITPDCKVKVDAITSMGQSSPHPAEPVRRPANSTRGVAIKTAPSLFGRNPKRRSGTSTAARRGGQVFTTTYVEPASSRPARGESRLTIIANALRVRRSKFGVDCHETNIRRIMFLLVPGGYLGRQSAKPRRPAVGRFEHGITVSDTMRR